MGNFTGRERLTVMAAALSAVSAIASGVVLALAFQVLDKAQRIPAQPIQPAASQRATADVRGSVLLGAGRHQPTRDNTGCAGTDKIANGMLVWVTDGNGDPVAEGQLVDGKVDQHGRCRLDFAVVGVPSGARQYTMSFESPAIDSIGIIDLTAPVQIYLG